MTNNDSENKSSWKFLAEGWRLLSKQEKSKGINLTIATFIISIIDMTGVASIMPLINMAMETDLLSQPSWIHGFYIWIGEPAREQFLGILAIITISLLTVATIFRFIVDKAIFEISATCASRLVHYLAEMLMKAPYIWFLKQNSSTIGRRIYADVGTWGSNYVKGIMILANSVITLLIVAVTVLYFTPISGLLILGTMLVITIFLMLPIRKRIEKLSITRLKEADITILSLNQAVGGIKDIKLSARESYFSKLISKHYKAMSTNTADVNILQLIPSSILILLGQLIMLITAIVLWTMGQSISEIVAQLALLVIASSRVIPAINRLNNAYTSLWNVYPFVEGIRKLQTELSTLVKESEKTSVGYKKPSDWNELKMADIAFSYSDNSAPAIRGITLTIQKNKSYGIVGQSGAGKSTLVDMLLGLITPNKGTITLDDVPFREFDLNFWQRHIGYVPQLPFITDDTLRSNVAFGIPYVEIDDDRVRECLNMAYLEDLISSLENGLDTVMGERGVRLSGGQRQRVAIARALYNKPTILIFDEATSALDTISESAVQKSINCLHGKLTTIIIAHRLSTIRDCDEIFLMENGMLVSSGNYEELSENNSLFKELRAENNLSLNIPATNFQPTIEN